VTARWKAESPQERLRHRGALQEVANYLKVAAEARARALNLDRNLGLDRAREPGLGRAYEFACKLDQALALDRALDLARDLALALDLVVDLVVDRDHALEAARDLALERALEATRGIDRALTHARELDHAGDSLDPEWVRVVNPRLGDLDRARVLARELDRALALDLALDLAPDRDLDRARELSLDRALEAARDLARDLGHARTIGLAIARELGLDTGHARAREIREATPTPDPDLTEAHGNLTDAANNFVGADLTTLDPDDMNLVGIRWDSNTRWPTPEWTDRIRRASVEDPPGSGVFVVLPEDGHNFADRDSLAPMS